MTKKEDDELAGFRDFIDGDTQLRRAVNSGNQSKRDGFEMFGFLELESKRLDKQLNVLEEKSYLIKNFDSFTKLNKEINKEISTANAKLMTRLYQKDSPMMKSIEEIFRGLFSS